MIEERKEIRNQSSSVGTNLPVRLVSSLLTSGEEPVGVLDDGLDDADDLQGNRGHHLCDVAAADGEQTGDFCVIKGWKVGRLHTREITEALKGENENHF